MLLLLANAPALADAEEPATFTQALKAGKPGLDLRYRFENVADDAVPEKEARASTLRTVLSYRSVPWKGFGFYVEAENVTAVGNDLYDNRGAGSLWNGVTDRPVVADPALTEVNQAYLAWERGDTSLRLGRQEITLGDHRFVGNVGWRQNHQSFDALLVRNTSFERLELTYGFVDRAHRIFGDSQGMASHLLNAAVSLRPGCKLTFYGYLLDYDDPNAFLSTATLGAEWVGERSLRARKLLWELEYAHQQDAGDNPRQTDAGYAHVLVGVALEPVTVKLGWELLDGSPAEGQFRTPLATLHRFNGWADKFLATPPDGLADLYLHVGGTAGPIGWAAIYHDFDSATGGFDYGDELDAQLTWKAAWGQLFGLKAALYSADRLSTDADKLWFWTAYSF